MFDEHGRRNLIPDPQHGRGYVPDGRPRTTSISGNNDQTGVPDSHFPVLHYLLKNGNKHDGRSKVVDNRRKDKSQERENPKNFFLAPCFYK